MKYFPKFQDSYHYSVKTGLTCKGEFRNRLCGLKEFLIKRAINQLTKNRFESSKNTINALKNLQNILADYDSFYRLEIIDCITLIKDFLPKINDGQLRKKEKVRINNLYTEIKRSYLK